MPTGKEGKERREGQIKSVDCKGGKEEEGNDDSGEGDEVSGGVCGRRTERGLYQSVCARFPRLLLGFLVFLVFDDAEMG